MRPPRRHVTSDMSRPRNIRADTPQAWSNGSSKRKVRIDSGWKDWKRHWPELATFFNYPEAVRRLIYTTNPIESLNSRVRKPVQGKRVFPTEIALIKALYLAVAEAEKRWTMRTRN